MEDEVTIESILGETKETTAAFTWIVPEVSIDTVMVEHVQLFYKKDLTLPRVTKILKKFL